MRNGILFLIGVSLVGALVSGSTCEKLTSTNLPPQTFFQEGGYPDSVLFIDHFDFKWFGRDPDSDFRDYYYRMFIGAACDSALPIVPDASWIRTRQQFASFSFADVHDFPDTSYVFEVLTQDERGATDLVPARTCFRLSIQLPPIVDSSTVSLPTPRTQGTSATLSFFAIKRDRAGRILPDIPFAYAWQLTQLSPSPGVEVPFADFQPRTSVTFQSLVPHAHYKFQVKAIDQRFPDIVSNVYDSGEWEN